MQPNPHPHKPLITNRLGIPKRLLGIILLLQRVQTGIKFLAVVQRMRRLRIVARIDVVEVSAKVRFRLRAYNGLVDAVDPVDGRRLRDRGPVAVVLEYPQRVAVVVGGEVGVLGVDGGAGAAVKVDDYEVSGNVSKARSEGVRASCLRLGAVLHRHYDAVEVMGYVRSGRVARDVVVEGVEGGGSETRRLGNGDRFGEEGVVLVVAGEGLGDVIPIGHELEVADPVVALDDDLLRGREGAQELGLDLVVELVDAAEEGAAEVVRLDAVEEDAVGNTVVDNRGVRAEILDVQKGVGEGLLVLEKHVSPSEGEVGYGLGRLLGAEVEVGHYAERFCCAANGPEDVGVLSIAGVHQGAVGKDDVSGDNVVESETPVAGSVAVSA